MALGIPKKEPTAARRYLILPYLFLFGYVVLRAGTLSFTHDEALSYRILLGDTMWAHTANNHWLNTFLMGIARRTLGEKELALRLPNVLAFGLYLFMLFHILRQHPRPWSLFWGSVLLLCNPFLLDFFSLARGYGLSMGLLMASLYFSFRSLRKYPSPQPYSRYATGSLFFAILGSLANLSLVNLLIALLILHTALSLRIFPHLAKKERLSLFSMAFITLLTILIEGIRLYWLYQHDQLYQGIGHLLGTVDSVVLNALYLVHYPSWLFQGIRTLILVLFFAGWLTLAFSRKRIPREFLFVASLLTLTVGGYVLEHFLFATNYPYGRSTLPLVMLYAFFLYYLALHLAERSSDKQKKAVVIFTLLLGLPLAGLFLTTTNLTYTDPWRYDAHTKDVMMLLDEVSSPSHPVTISNHWLFEPAINYYILSRDMRIPLTDREGPKPGTDYIYLFATDTLPAGYEVKVQFKDINTLLCEKAENIPAQDK